MKKTISCMAAGAFVAAALMGGASAHASAASPAFQYGQQDYYPNEQWAVPPSQWQAAEQKGFREGVRGAYKDAQNHRQPNVDNRDEYRNPDRDDIPGDQVGAYREGFQRGYWTGVRHLMGYYSGPNPYQDQDYQSSAYQQYGQPGYYPNEPWAQPPSQWQAAEQKGYRDGVRGAYKDAQNHRQPDINNRDEYRNPDADDIPGHNVDAYRQGFQRGYWTGVHHLMGYYSGPNPYPEGYQQYDQQQYGQEGYYPNEPWANPSSDWQAVEQKGYRDGVRGAYKDAQNHRQPNVNNRDEYRHPDVPHQDRRAYREGFQRGYWAGVQHLMGYYHGSNPYGGQY